jgi:hypothetical protein
MGICCIKAAEGCAWMGNALPCHGKDQVVIDKPIRRHKWTPSEVQTIWRKTQSREHPEHTECLYCGDLLGRGNTPLRTRKRLCRFSPPPSPHIFPLRSRRSSMVPPMIPTIVWGFGGKRKRTNRVVEWQCEAHATELTRAIVCAFTPKVDGTSG